MGAKRWKIDWTVEQLDWDYQQGTCTCGHAGENHWHTTVSGGRDIRPPWVGGCGVAGCGCYRFSTTVRNIEPDIMKRLAMVV